MKQGSWFGKWEICLVIVGDLDSKLVRLSDNSFPILWSYDFIALWIFIVYANFYCILYM